MREPARIAGVSYALAVVTAVSGEALVRGRLAVAAGLVAVACFVAVTLLLYVIFKRVDKGFVLLASLSGLVGLTFEALRWNPRGVDFGVVFDGIYCLLIGYLAFRSAFTPRILGVRMAIAGLAWLTHLSPALARSLNP